MNIDLLRELFLYFLTTDSETKDARRKDFNQAIFINPKEPFSGGEQVFNGTDLDMVLEKFDKAVKVFKLDIPEVEKP